TRIWSFISGWMNMKFPPRRVSLIRTVYLLLVLSGHQVWADDKVPWNQLTSDQQDVLQVLKDSWDEIRPERQQRLQNMADKWSEMSEDEQNRLQKRMQHWQSLSPEERKDIRKRYKKFRDMP